MTKNLRWLTGLIFIGLNGAYAASRSMLGETPTGEVIAAASLLGIALLFLWVFIRSDEVERRVVLEASTAAFLITALAIAMPEGLIDVWNRKTLWAIAAGSWLIAYVWRMWRVAQ